MGEECRPRQLKDSVQVMDGAQVVVMQAVPLGGVVDFGSRLWVKVGVPWEAEEVDLLQELQVDYKRIQHSSLALSPT